MDPTRATQQLVPWAQQIFQYDAQKPENQRDAWFKQFVEWKKPMVIQAREKLANDPHLSKELIRLCKEAKEVNKLSNNRVTMA